MCAFDMSNVKASAASSTFKNGENGYGYTPLHQVRTASIFVFLIKDFRLHVKTTHLVLLLPEVPELPPLLPLAPEVDPAPFWRRAKRGILMVVTL
jgi:hypothetical protein